MYFYYQSFIVLTWAQILEMFLLIKSLPLSSMSQFIFEFINQNYLVNRCTRFETRFHLIESHRNYEYYSLSRVFPGIIAKYNNPDSKRIFGHPRFSPGGARSFASCSTLIRGETIIIPIVSPYRSLATGRKWREWEEDASGCKGAGIRGELSWVRTIRRNGCRLLVTISETGCPYLFT